MTKVRTEYKNGRSALSVPAVTNVELSVFLFAVLFRNIPSAVRGGQIDQQLLVARKVFICLAVVALCKVILIAELGQYDEIYIVLWKLGHVEKP